MGAAPSHSPPARSVITSSSLAFALAANNSIPKILLIFKFLLKNLSFFDNIYISRIHSLSALIKKSSVLSVFERVKGWEATAQGGFLPFTAEIGAQRKFERRSTTATRCNIKVLSCLKDERRINPSGCVPIFATANMKQSSLEKLIVLNLNRQPQDHYLSYHFSKAYVKSEKPRNFKFLGFSDFRFYST